MIHARRALVAALLVAGSLAVAGPASAVTVGQFCNQTQQGQVVTADTGESVRCQYVPGVTSYRWSLVVPTTSTPTTTAPNATGIISTGPAPVPVQPTANATGIIATAPAPSSISTVLVPVPTAGAAVPVAGVLALTG